jgi:uncharacterized protein YbbC (DUF1343 family)
MEEAAKAGIHIVVLDRPNPITGRAVAGPIADADSLGFTAWHPMPVRHGLTVGELAKLFNAERKIGAGLIVVPCEGWKRGMWWDETGLTWTNPSPNMRSLTQALLYPGVGLLEFTNLSVGRGTDTPFEVIGAPWMDGRKLAQHLNARKVPGLRFIRYTPRSSVHSGVECQGINFHVTDRDRIEPLRLGMELAAALRDLFPTGWKHERYSRLLASRTVFGALTTEDATAEALERSWQADLRRFQEIRRNYLIYPA